MVLEVWLGHERLLLGLGEEGLRVEGRIHVVKWSWPKHHSRGGVEGLEGTIVLSPLIHICTI